MFKKVLIVDDHASINNDVFEILKQEGVDEIHKALYCDDAYLKFQKALHDEVPFDLVITDLLFKKDHRERKLTSGKALIAELRSQFESLPIIVFTHEDHFQTVRILIQDFGASAYVCKSRISDKELPKALKKVYAGELFLSEEVEMALLEKNENEISDYDLFLMRMIAEGHQQAEIGKRLRQSRIYPNSTSSIEKRLNILKDQFAAKNTTHLVSILKDHKLI